MESMSPQNRCGAGIILSTMFFFQACSSQNTTVASQGPRVVADPPRKILFIGNSLTYSNDGIYTHLQKLTASAVPRMEIEAYKAVVGGPYFKLLWGQFPAPPRAV